MIRVSVIELPATWGEAGPALELVDRVLGDGPPSDVTLLPEMSLRGYVSPAIEFDLTSFAEPIDGPTALALSSLARKHATHLVGPLVLEENGALFNATVGFAPDGSRFLLYKKRNPWIPEEWATAGSDPYPLFTINSVTITVACCYDLHFVAREAHETLDAADLLLFPSAWVEERDSRPRRLSTIARTHRLAVAAANWGPGLLHVKGQGGSMILDAKGEVLARVDPGMLRADATISP